MNIEQALALMPEGWELISFDNSGRVTFKREGATLIRNNNGVWHCKSRVRDDRDVEGEAFLTQREAIEDCRRILETRRENLFAALRNCK